MNKKNVSCVLENIFYEIMEYFVPHDKVYSECVIWATHFALRYLILEFHSFLLSHRALKDQWRIWIFTMMVGINVQKSAGRGSAVGGWERAGVVGGSVRVQPSPTIDFCAGTYYIHFEMVHGQFAVRWLTLGRQTASRPDSSPTGQFADRTVCGQDSSPTE